MHSNTEEGCTPLKLKLPPVVAPRPIACFLWAPFNKPKLVVSFSKDDTSFNNHAVNDNGLPPLWAMIATDAQLATVDPRIKTMYYFHRPNDKPSNLVGSAVMSVGGICPALTPIVNTNIFGHYFGIQFCHDGHTYIHAISPFEFVSCFRLSDNITYKLLHPSNAFCMDATVPALTSICIFEHVLDRCIQIRSRNFEIFQPNQHAALAACVQAFLNGSIGVRLPCTKVWAHALLDNPTTASIIHLHENPGTSSNKNPRFVELNANYHAALRQSHLVLEDDILVYQEPIAGSESYA
jgi:hypothetical protein